VADDSLGSRALPTDVAAIADAPSAPQPPQSTVQAVVAAIYGAVVFLTNSIWPAVAAAPPALIVQRH
jgi:hypothetical protein